MNKSTIYGVGIGIVIGGMIYTVLYMWDEQEYYMGLDSTVWDEQEYYMGLVAFRYSRQTVGRCLAVPFFKNCFPMFSTSL